MAIEDLDLHDYSYIKLAMISKGCVRSKQIADKIGIIKGIKGLEVERTKEGKLTYKDDRKVRK